jgi:glycosyltransferase involved in cell wall biosynthesis
VDGHTYFVVRHTAREKHDGLAGSLRLCCSGCQILEKSYKVKHTLMNIQTHFQSGRWLPAAQIERSFVKHIHFEDSPGKVWLYHPSKKEVRLSVIIPTFDANRGGYFLKLLEQISCQDFNNFEVIIVRGDSRQGRAINIAAALSRGIYLLTLDDDTSLPDKKTFSKLVSLMGEDADALVRRVMRELPRRSWKPVDTITDSDLAEHPCMIMRADEFKAIGGENELIPRGLDPYIRQEFRKSDKRVVVIPGVIYHHLPPSNLNKLMSQFFRNGRQAAYTNKKYPQWIIETPQRHGQFKMRKSFFFRFLRFPIRLLRALITGKPIWFMCEVFYALGFAREYISSEKL